jgi:hypothetical protein
LRDHWKDLSVRGLQISINFLNRCKSAYASYK